MPLVREFEQFTNRTSGNAAEVQIQPLSQGSPGQQTVRMAGNIMAAKLTAKPEAVYPERARQARIQGTVRSNVLVSATRSVENVTLVSGHPLLVPSAMEALRNYRYQPTLLNGVPVVVVTQVDIPFTLP
ncbi:MAG: energy transducer TonB [Bryobacteraceae bacterium]